PATRPKPVLSRDEFMVRVERAREYIAAGDIYQANLSCRFDADRPQALKAEALYRRLRQVNPSPFACLL
ncbi:MAG: anthranilate synthase component I family protein, partial [Desulfuromonadales bacterium]|nr:anthranilate synthase component I family protein [Desulfuromonadales bacterium]NIS41100.1 anthranilate synthase component I family protein [Desulfuromonadales bacterium]